MNMQKSKPKNNSKWILLGLAAIAVIVTVVLLLKPASDVLPATVSVQQATDKISNGAYLVDVREPSEWNEAHVEGAILIPLGELSARINEIPTDKDVLVICRSGNRSGQARDLLRAAGLSQTTSIEGGITAWISAGLPVVSGP